MSCHSDAFICHPGAPPQNEAKLTVAASPSSCLHVSCFTRTPLRQSPTVDPVTPARMTDVETRGRAARRAGYQLATLQPSVKVAALHRIAAALRTARQQLLEANAQDVAAAEKAGVARPLVERLKLNDKRIEQMAAGVEQIAAQTDPVGQTIEGYTRPNGLRSHAAGVQNCSTLQAA